MPPVREDAPLERRVDGDAAGSTARPRPGSAVPGPPRPLRLVVVEDEVIVALAIREVVEDLGHAVVGMARSDDEALRLVERYRPDLALMDVRLASDTDGIEAARRLHALYGVRSVFLSAYADHATMARVTATYPLGVVHKPFSSAQLKIALDLAARRLRGVRRADPAVTPERTPSDRTATTV